MALKNRIKTLQSISLALGGENLSFHILPPNPGRNNFKIPRFHCRIHPQFDYVIVAMLPS